MKNLLLFAFILTFAVACNQPKSEVSSEDSAPVAEAAFAFYGDKISPDGATDLNEFVKTSEVTDSVMVKLEGTIDATCAMKGCWMTMKTDEGDVRVTFKDYGFFVPSAGQEGKTAIVEGVAVRTVTDVATLRHYAQDAGKSQEEIEAITEPQEGIALIATGVAISE